MMNDEIKTVGEDVKPPAGADPVPTAKPAKMRAAFRDLKCTLPSEEFGAVQWAGGRARREPGRKPTALPLAEFMRGALLARVRDVVRGEIARGKKIPPDIAATLDRGR